MESEIKIKVSKELDEIIKNSPKRNTNTICISESDYQTLCKEKKVIKIKSYKSIPIYKSSLIQTGLIYLMEMSIEEIEKKLSILKEVE